MMVQCTNTYRLGGICLPAELHTADMTKATQQSVFFAVAVSQKTFLLILTSLLLKQVLSDTEACVVFTEVRLVLFVSLTKNQSVSQIYSS